MLPLAEYSNVYREIGTGESLEGEDMLEFRLLYEGLLLGSSDVDTRAKEKHKVRKVFHPQLRRLWNVHYGLDMYAQTRSRPWEERHPDVDMQKVSKEELRQAGIESMSYNWERAGFRFVPLVTKELFLRCRIEILFLRPEEPRFLMQRGDLDARLKTIFDALRIPENRDETGGASPADDEDPFFCLLEDDKLITEVSVTSDELLVLPKERRMNPNDVFLLLHVKVQPNRQDGLNWNV